jgi:hypothetical protein
MNVGIRGLAPHRPGRPRNLGRGGAFPEGSMRMVRMMAKRRTRLGREARVASDMMTIGLFAPIVMASRLSGLAEHAWRPTAARRREGARMAAEKPAAAVEAVAAIQREMARAGFETGRAMLAASLTPVASASAVMSVWGAGARPVNRRVHANAARLARKAVRRGG